MIDFAQVKTADIVVENYGTVILLRGMTRAGSFWLIDHVSSEPWQWIGNAVACEPRLVQAVIDGAEEDGLRVAV